VSDSIKFGVVALDCPDAGELAAFYAGITGHPFCLSTYQALQQQA
jgi:hypothetical protein